MRSATYLHSAYRARPDPRSRAFSAALALALVVALIWALLSMGGLPGVNGRGDPTSLILFSPTAEKAAEAARAAPQEKRRTVPRTAPVPRPREPQQVPDTPPEVVIDVPGFIRMSRSDYAATDIGKIQRSPLETADAGGAGSGAGDSPSEPGAAPGGEPLYYAEWYREPTHAETGPFMPVNTVGWGIVACRTAPRYRVEDCRELGESPGSGIARGLRRAAWQFLVRPPRKGNKPLIGAWVRIRFDLTAAPDDKG